MNIYKILTIFLFLIIFSMLSDKAPAEEVKIPLGDKYSGPKCVIAIGDFAVQVPGAPPQIGNGLREMLQTALFESNYFIVVDRMDTAGISAEQLLSDSFMANPDAILQQGKMDPAEVMVYGTLIALEGGGGGLRIKIPWMPINLGGTHYEAKATVELRVVDSATSRVIAVSRVDSTAESGKGSFGTTLKGIDIPVELEMFKNTPLELCIRDSIYRAIINLLQDMPANLFRHRE